MNNFILNYKGNKYLESKRFFQDFDFSEYDIIVEPFCGIFGFSRYAYEKGFKGEFYLNDLSTELINVLKELKTNQANFINNIEEELEKYKEDADLSRDKNKTYGLKLISCSAIENLCQIKKAKTKLKNYKIKSQEYHNFFKKVHLFNQESQKFIEELPTYCPKNKKILIFYDPPYFNSSNTSYSLYLNKDDDGYADGTQLYLNIINNFKSLNIKQVMILNHISLIHHLLKDYYISTICGKYQIGKKNIKKHSLYQN